MLRNALIMTGHVGATIKRVVDRVNVAAKGGPRELVVDICGLVVDICGVRALLRDCQKAQNHASGKVHDDVHEVAAAIGTLLLRRVPATSRRCVLSQRAAPSHILSFRLLGVLNCSP